METKNPPVVFAMPPQQIPRQKILPSATSHEYLATTGEPERLSFYHQYHVPPEGPPNASVAVVDENGGTGSLRLCGGPAPHTQSRETFPGWMARMWKEPPAGDVGSCCLAFWIPAVLSGKTDWRLKQASRGKNAQDTAWRAKAGCNGACWSYIVLEYFVGLGFVPIALQRSRVRAVYGIEGTAAEDWALAIFCRPCTILQNDREVRAREGKHDLLSNNKNYKEHQKAQAKFVNSQPGAIQPMSYRSQQSNLEKSRRPGTESISKERQNPQATLTKCNKEANSSRPGAVDGSGDQFPTQNKSQSKAPQIVHPSLTHYRDQPLTKSRPARITHRGSLGRTDSPRQENASLREHALLECVGDGTSSPRWITKTKKMIGASEVSYVHDFTDCAVDKSILDYYDRQGKAMELNEANFAKEQPTAGSPSVDPQSSRKRF